jgi:hypothetical protein
MGFFISLTFVAKEKELDLLEYAFGYIYMGVGDLAKVLGSVARVVGDMSSWDPLEISMNMGIDKYGERFPYHICRVNYYLLNFVL